MVTRTPPKESSEMPPSATATNDPEPVENEEPTGATTNNPEEDPPEPADIDRESR